MPAIDKTPGPYFVDEHGKVWKASIAKANPDGSTNHTLSFQVSEPLPDYITLGPLEGSHVMAEMLNRAARYDDMLDALHHVIATLQGVVDAMQEPRMEDGRFVEDARQKGDAT